VLSAVLSSYYLIEPPETFALGGTSDWIGLAFFLIVAGTITVLVDALSRASSQSLVAAQELQQLNQELETRIATRTQELAEANAQLRNEIETREAAEARVRQIQKMEALGQLTGGVAHDFNNMLAIVIGNLDLAQRRLAQGRSDILKLIESSLEGALRAATLTQRLLAFSRQQPLAPAVIDINGLVSGMAELLRHTIGDAIELECVLAGGLWRTRVDPGQLENAILNLAVNARDAMAEGGRLTIETVNARLDEDYAELNSDVTPGQYVMLAVSDTGAGMSPEIAAQAFDPFFTTKESGQGTGLGLSQVYGFIKQTGGHVKIYSELGGGTTVKVYLPRDFSNGRVASADGRPASEPALPIGAPAEIILVVEDEERVRHTTVAALRELRYTVRHTGSADEALSILGEQPGIKLLLTDVVMPGMTGRKLAEAASQARSDLKILYMTGYTSNAIVHNNVLDPDVELLPKPFALDQLARKVRSVLDRA
jgi:signal transduction histidine kinase